MIFAVKRDVSLAVNTPSASDPEFSVNLGFKERQAAWVPLWANEKTGGFGEKETKSCAPQLGSSACKRSAKFVGDSDPGRNGNDANDAYSTFASFGGAVGTQVQGASATTAQFNGNLASFFATGVAAQHLAKEASQHDMTGTRSAESGSRKSPEALAAGKLQAAVVKDTRDSVEDLFVMTALHSSSNPAFATVHPDCLSKLAKELNEKTPPDLSWVKARSPEDAAKALITLGGISQADMRKLSAAANSLSSKIKPELANYEAANKDKPEERTPSKLAAKAAQTCAS
ncbi:MAG: hypothetical protein ACKO1L_11755 [Brachymonas sp.]